MLSKADLVLALLAFEKGRGLKEVLERMKTHCNCSKNSTVVDVLHMVFNDLSPLRIGFSFNLTVKCDAIPCNF